MVEFLDSILCISFPGILVAICICLVTLVAICICLVILVVIRLIILVAICLVSCHTIIVSFHSYFRRNFRIITDIL